MCVLMNLSFDASLDCFHHSWPFFSKYRRLRVVIVPVLKPNEHPNMFLFQKLELRCSLSKRMWKLLVSTFRVSQYILDCSQKNIKWELNNFLSFFSIRVIYLASLIAPKATYKTSSQRAVDSLIGS
jgi:hypothetical protein